MPGPTKNSPVKAIKPIKAYWLAFAWAAIILLLTGLPGKDLPDYDIWDFEIEDKLAHIFVFALLGWLLIRSYRRMKQSKKVPQKIVFLNVGVAIAFAALTEILQDLIFVGRFASITDFLADTIGILLGTVFALKGFLNRLF
jgi:VanZ family protein